MEIFMGNVICGDNADTPTPYDFAMGGAGLSCSIPVGCNGSLIRPGMAVMVDMCGNFTGYIDVYKRQTDEFIVTYSLRTMINLY